MNKKSTPYCFWNFEINSSLPSHGFTTQFVVVTSLTPPCTALLFAFEQLISLCCRVGTSNRSIISVVREERVVLLCVLASLAFCCTSQVSQEFARVSDCN